MTDKRLSKDTTQLLKIAQRVEFIRYQFESGRQQVIAFIYISNDAFPISAKVGGDRWWDAHDIEKAKRSIRRHNKTCLIIDKRNQIITKDFYQQTKSLS